MADHALSSTDDTVDAQLCYRDIENAIGYCERQIRRMVRKGTFPAPIRVGNSRKLAWPAAAVAAWLASQKGA